MEQPSKTGPFPPNHASLADRLQQSADTGGLTTLDRLVPEVFDELRALAHRQLARESDPVTLQTTELVHEAYLRLLGTGAVTRKGRAYFFAAAGRAMRQVLVDAARRRGTAKRGGGARLLDLQEAEGALTAFSHELLELDTALQKL